MFTRIRRAGVVGVLVGFGGLVLSCQAREQPAKPIKPVGAAPQQPAAVLEVEYTGCSATRSDPATCLLQPGEHELVLWAHSGGQPVVVSIDGSKASWVRPLATVQGGQRLRIVLPAEAQELVVAGHEQGQEQGPSWRLTIERTPPTPIVAQLLRRLSEVGVDKAAIEAAVARILELPPTASLAERLAGQRLLVRSYLHLGRFSEAIETGRGAIQLALEYGEIGLALDVIQLLAHYYARGPDAKDGRWLRDLQQLYIPLSGDAKQHVLADYYEGAFAGGQGELGTRLQLMERAAGRAERLGLVKEELSANAMRVKLLGLFGRFDERRELIARIEVLTQAHEGTDRCEAANEVNNAAWGLLLTTKPGDSTADALRLLERAHAVFTPGAGCDPNTSEYWQRGLQEIRLNLALEAIARRKPAVAAKHLEAMAGKSLTSTQSSWAAYARARIEMLHGKPGQAARRLQAIGDAALEWNPLLAWQVAVLLGRALEEHGRRPQALQAYLVAEAALERMLQSVGLDQGREGLLAGLHTSASNAIDVLLSQGNIAMALKVARRSRARAMRPIGRTAVLASASAGRNIFAHRLTSYRELARGLETELATLWQQPADARAAILRRHGSVRAMMHAHLESAYAALRDSSSISGAPPETRPAQGELWLLYHPLPAPRSDASQSAALGPKRWVAFAIEAEHVRAQVVHGLEAGASETELSAKLLGPFSSQINRAKRLHILPMHGLHSVAFHALPWDGGAVLDTVPVAYAMDLAATVSTRDLRLERALVVADPATVLPGVAALAHAADEGALAAAKLRQHGSAVVLLSHDEVSHAAVTVGLAQADLFHYAGHGVARGAAGWDSALLLAGESSLDVRAVMALGRVPGAVVLVGCQTGILDPTLPSGGMSLASAFLASGAEFVMAASDDVPDAEALAFTTALYESLDSDNARPLHGARWAQETAQRLRASGNEVWRSFRVWVR